MINKDGDSILIDDSLLTNPTGNMSFSLSSLFSSDINLNYKCKKGTKDPDNNKCSDEMESKTKDFLSRLDKRVLISPENISLKGLKTDYIDVLIKTLNDESKDGPIVMNSITTLSGKKNSYMSYNQGSRQLSIPYTAVRSQQNRDVGTLSGVIGEYDSAIKILTERKNESNNPKIWMKAAGLIYKYEEEKERILSDAEKYGFKPKGAAYMFDDQRDRFKSVLLHEIGHYRWDEMEEGEKSKIKNVFDNTKRKDFLTENSRRNEEEWFCETFSLVKMGKVKNDVVERIIHGISKTKQKLNYKCKKGTKNPDTNECVDNTEASDSGKNSVKKNKFVPMKTREDAEKFSYNNLIDEKERMRVERWNSGETAKTTPDKVEQIKLISYRGMDVRVANLVNEYIKKNVDIGLPKFKRITTTQFKKTPSVLMRVSGSGSLEINTISMGNLSKINASLDSARKLHSSETELKMESLGNSYDKMTEKQKKVYDSLKETLKYDRGCIGYETYSNPERAIEATINHECAHTITKIGKYGYGSPQYDEFRDAWRSAVKDTLNSDYKYRLSSYGCQPKLGAFVTQPDAEETFAEMYSAWRFHEDDKLHPNAVKMFKKYLPER